MTTVMAGAGTGLAPLQAAVARRSPAVAAALDVEEATERARHWAAAVLPEAPVAAVRVRSVLYRPDDRCTLRYHVRLAGPGPERVLLVEVPGPDADPLLRPFPADPRLPTLARAVDPDLMRLVLGRVVPGIGGERAVGRCAVDVVRYPRVGRCVLRYRLRVGAGGAGELRHPVVFGKVYGNESARAAAAALRLLRDRLAAPPDGPAVVVPRTLGVVPALRLGLAEPIPGRPVLELLRTACEPAAGGSSAPDALVSAIRAAARTAAAVHAASPAGARLPVRDLADDASTAERDVASLDTVWPEAGTRLRTVVARALALTADSVALPPVLAHGDFTPGQVLVDGSGRPGVVDVDTLCVAEPALDIGRFLAYLHVAGVRRFGAAVPLMAELTEVFMATYLEARPTPPGAAAARRLLAERTAAYRALSLARIGASACRQLKDDRLAAVLQVVDEGGDWVRSAAR